MLKLVDFTSFISQQKSLDEGLQTKAAGDFIIIDVIDDDAFQQKKGIPYIRIKDDSVEFLKSTPVDSSSLAFRGKKNPSPGVYFLQQLQNGDQTEKKFFSQSQIKSNAYDIILQIYTLLFKEGLQEADLEALKDLTKSIILAQKKVGASNDTFLDFVTALKDEKNAEKSMPSHGKNIDNQTKSEIIDAISSAFKNPG